MVHFFFNHPFFWIIFFDHPFFRSFFFNRPFFRSSFKIVVVAGLSAGQKKKGFMGLVGLVGLVGLLGLLCLVWKRERVLVGGPAGRRLAKVNFATKTTTIF